MKFVKQITICLIFLSILFYSAAAYAGPLVAVDPGHGGWDSGAVGPTGLKEKFVNLDIGLRLDSLLKSSGYRTIMTRRTDTALGPDLNSDLGGRVAIAAAADADIFISIHNNSSFSPSAGGSETYYYTKPNGYSDPKSRLLAQLVQQNLAAEVGRYNRGVKTANFYVLRNTSTQAILVEGLFISNPTEEAMLSKGSVRQAIAQGIFAGIKEYFSMVNVVETSVWRSVSNGSSFSDFQKTWSSGINNWDWRASKPAARDFNRNGFSDLAVLYGYSGSRSRIWNFINNGATINPPFIAWDSGPGNWDWGGSKIAGSDINGDGLGDLAVLYGYGGNRARLWVFPNKGDGRFSAPHIAWDSGAGNWAWSASKFISGDFNGDNKSDLAVLYGYGGNRARLWVFPNKGDGSFSAPHIAWDSGAGNWAWSASKFISGDFNGDGQDDLAVLYGYGGARSRLWVFLNNGSGGFNAPTIWWDSGPGNWDWAGSKLASGDFDGDNRDDLAVLYGYFNERQTRAFVFKSNGTTAFNAPTKWWDSGPGNWDWAGIKLTAGNYNGDNKSDLSGLYNANH